MAASVAVLFARRDSCYKGLDLADVWDADRDARGYRGAAPVVAHPPCRAWGKLRHMAKPRHDERELALFAVEAVRRFGGVLEHPAGSLLWDAAALPAPGMRDEFGGFTMPIRQSWFGHPAPKNTWLYVVGVEPRDVPAFPLLLGSPPGRVVSLGRRAREATPVELASWLIDLARRCQ